MLSASGHLSPLTIFSFDCSNPFSLEKPGKIATRFKFPNVGASRHRLQSVEYCSTCSPGILVVLEDSCGVLSSKSLSILVNPFKLPEVNIHTVFFQKLWYELADFGFGVGLRRSRAGEHQEKCAQKEGGNPSYRKVRAVHLADPICKTSIHCTLLQALANDPVRSLGWKRDDPDGGGLRKCQMAVQFQSIAGSRSERHQPAMFRGAGVLCEKKKRILELIPKDCSLSGVVLTSGHGRTPDGCSTCDARRPRGRHRR